MVLQKGTAYTDEQMHQRPDATGGVREPCDSQMLSEPPCSQGTVTASGPGDRAFVRERASQPPIGLSALPSSPGSYATKGSFQNANLNTGVLFTKIFTS